MSANAPHFYAHSADGERTPSPKWQLLREHLAGVAAKAKELAEATGVPDLPAAAEAAGWLHDLGKYRQSFQHFIRGLSPQGSKQHKEAGAAFAFENRLPDWFFRAGLRPSTPAISAPVPSAPWPARSARKNKSGSAACWLAIDQTELRRDESPGCCTG